MRDIVSGMIAAIVLIAAVGVILFALMYLWTAPNVPAGYSTVRDGQRMATQLANIENDLQIIKTQIAGPR